jgi:hypothetical protein
MIPIPKAEIPLEAPYLGSEGINNPCDKKKQRAAPHRSAKVGVNIRGLAVTAEKLAWLE